MSCRPLPAAALTALALVACATPRKPDYPSVSYRSQSAALPTGMRVLTYEIEGGGLFSLAASYRAGSADDPPGKEGLAALVGRLALRAGGEAEGRLGYSQRLLAAGVRFDARVGRDTTDFIASGPASRLAAVLQVEADRLRDPLAGVTHEEFRRQRDLYAEELAEQRLASRGDAGSQWLLELALGAAPYARPVGGTPESVRALALADASAWARQRFTPAHLVVAATAPGSGTGLKVLQAFGTLATGEGDGVPALARSVPPVPAPDFPVVTPDFAGPAEPVVRRAPVSGAQLWIGWVLPGDASVDAARAQAALGLAPLLVGRAALDRGSDITNHSRSAYGFTLAALRVEAGNEENAREVLRHLRKEDVPSLRLARYVGAVTGDELLRSEYFKLEQPDVTFMAREVRLSQGGDPLTMWRRKVASSLSTGFEEWAERWLDPRRAVALLVLPEPGREEPSEVTPPGATPRWATALPFQPQLPPGRYDVLDLVPPPGLDPAVRTRLRNGLEVVVLRRAGFPRIEGRLVVRMRPVGTPDVPSPLPTLALISVRPAFSFIWSSCPLAAAEFLGDHFVAQSSGTSTRLDEVLGKLACWAGSVTADGDEVRWAKKRLAALWRSLQDTPEFAVARYTFERTFPGWTGTWGEPAATDAISAGAVRDWLESELRPDRATLILTGDLDPGTELSRAIEDAFGGWKVRSDAGPLPTARTAPAGPPGPAKVLLGHRAGARTALIQVGLRAPPLGEQDLAAEQAWMAEVRRVLSRDRGEGGLGDVRLIQLDRVTGHSALFLETRVKAESAAWSLRRLLEALGGTAVAPPTEGVAAVQRWNVAVDLPFRFASAHDLADRLAELAVSGGPPDFWERHRASVASLDGARIQAAARSFSVGRELAAVVGDREVIEPQLRAAGFKVELVETPPAPAGK